jgi:hypothetical protein
MSALHGLRNILEAEAPFMRDIMKARQPLNFPA